jgi:uncharacterized protein (DUF3084 family)
MASGFFLIGAILLIGGLIAVSGDRIGTKVGKARLSLFKLRPKQTATLVTIVVGTLISAGTLVLLFATNEQLRTGLFDLQKLQSNLDSTQQNLNQALDQNDRFKNELIAARTQQNSAREDLSSANQLLQNEVAQVNRLGTDIKATREELDKVNEEHDRLQREIDKLARSKEDLTAKIKILKNQIGSLKQDVAELRDRNRNLIAKASEMDDRAHPQNSPAERDRQTAVRDAQNSIENNDERLANLERQQKEKESALVVAEDALKKSSQSRELLVAQRDAKDKQRQALKQRISNLVSQQKEREKEVDKQTKQVRDRERRLSSLATQLKELEKEYEKFRQGDVVILRNGVLAFGVLKVTQPSQAQQAIDRVLSEANKTSIAALYPARAGADDDRVVEIHRFQVERAIERLRDGGEYVVRVVSTGNYILGDRKVIAILDVAPNVLAIRQGESLAETIVESSQPADDDRRELELRQQLNQILATCQLRAKRAGILSEPAVEIGDGKPANGLRFLERLKQTSGSVKIRAIAATNARTAGPLRIRLEAYNGGQSLFTSDSN